MGHPEDCRPLPYPERMACLREKIDEYGGISKVARDTGFSREGISRALSPTGNMRLKMWWDITKLVNFHWCVQVGDAPPEGRKQ